MRTSYRNVVILISLIMTSLIQVGKSQMVLDAPFIMSREFSFSVQPQIFNSYELKFENDAYPSSFLYAEPVYARVRVNKLLDFNSNEAFKTVPYSTHLRDSSGNWSNVTKESEIQINDSIIGIYMPKRMIQLNGHKVLRDSILEGPESFIDNLAVGYYYFEYLGLNSTKVNDKGVLATESTYFPAALEIKSFKDILHDEFARNELTGYPTSEFNSYLKSEEVVNYIGTKENSKIKGLRLAEDYYIHETTGKLSSEIIGIGIIGEDKTPGNELMWFYYPELKNVIRTSCNSYNGKVHNYEYLLDYHHFNSEIESFENLGSFSASDNEFSVKLESLVELDLRLEYLAKISEKPLTDGKYHLQKDGPLHDCTFHIENKVLHGEVTLKYDNGDTYLKGNMENGLREGTYKYYYPSGELKAIRNFKHNILDGEQKSYWDNGKVYCRYTFKEGNIFSLKRFYRDGVKLEQGGFQNGVPIGDWKYNVKLDDEKLAKFFWYTRELETYYNKKGYFNYTVNYEHDYESKGCYKFCLGSKLLK